MNKIKELTDFYIWMQENDYNHNIRARVERKAEKYLKEQDWEMFKVFAKLHPVEAYDSRPDDFCKFMRGEGYDLNNEQIKELVDSSR
jgi:hypothetical protein